MICMKGLGKMVIVYYKNPEINADRFYSMDVMCDLFGESILLRTWGRRGKNGKTLMVRYDNHEQATAAMLAIEKKKMRKGYVAGSSRDPPCLA